MANQLLISQSLHDYYPESVEGLKIISSYNLLVQTLENNISSLVSTSLAEPCVL
jgi:hypothetical protein